MSSTASESTTKTSPDLFADIREFHEKFELVYEGPPRALPIDLLKFRTKFLYEEVDEYDENSTFLTDALDKSKPDIPDEVDDITQSLALQLDALVDLVYVAVGTAYLHGFDFNEAWRRVHAANMKKVRAQKASDSKRGSTHDVVKPAGWTPPDHSDLVANHAHAETS